MPSRRSTETTLPEDLEHIVDAPADEMRSAEGGRMTINNDEAS